MSIVLSVLLSYSFCIIGQFYLNGTIKIRGGSSCHWSFEAPKDNELVLHTFALSRTKWFADSLSCSHTLWKNSFFHPKTALTWPFFSDHQCRATAAGRRSAAAGLDSFSKIWSPQLRRKERKMCFGDKQRNFHSQLLSIESLLSWERWLHFAHFIWLQNDNFHEYDSHFLSRDLRRKRFSDQLWGA